MRLRGPVVPRIRRHPLTGEPIEPVGWVNGRPIYPIMGGAPKEGEDDDDDDDDDKAGKSGSTDDSGAGDDGDDDDTSGGGDGDDTVSRAEFESLKKRMKAADKRADEAEKKVREREDAEKSDLDKATTRVQELEKQNESLTETVNTLRFENAFLSSNTHNWNDSEVALTVARTKGYLEGVVSDDGEVDKKALKAALDKLAKEQSYLVKTSKGSDDDGGGGSSGSSASRRSDNNKDEKARREQLKRRFPSLNR